MLRIGCVNLDTSHPSTFAAHLVQGSRARYTAVYNDGHRTDEEVAAFMSKFSIPERCKTLDALVDQVDAGFVHSCNWNKNITLAEPFVRKGKPVFIDKPIAGSLKDCLQLEAWARAGAVILGSSSLRYCREVRSFLERPEAERGHAVQVLATVGNDEFNYAIHAVEMIGGLVGTGAESCRHVGRAETGGHVCDTYFVRFAGGVSAQYHIFLTRAQPFTAVIMTSETTATFQVNNKELYRALLDQILDHLETGRSALAEMPALTESVKIMLAGRLSQVRGGPEVFLRDLREDDPGFDGDAFERAYVERRRRAAPSS